MATPDQFKQNPELLTSQHIDNESFNPISNRHIHFVYMLCQNSFV